MSACVVLIKQKAFPESYELFQVHSLSLFRQKKSVPKLQTADLGSQLELMIIFLYIVSVHKHLSPTLLKE